MCEADFCYDEGQWLANKLQYEREHAYDPVIEKIRNQRAELKRLNDTINRQKEEIERLEEAVEDKQFRCDACDRIALSASEHRFCVKQAKAEATKEFAERLKDKICNEYGFVVFVEEIDNLVKEMAGEQ